MDSNVWIQKREPGWKCHYYSKDGGEHALVFCRTTRSERELPSRLHATFNIENPAEIGLQLTCFLFDLTENAEERRFHSVTVEGMFPFYIKKMIKKTKRKSYWST